MSVRCQAWVYEFSEATANDRLVLLAIADEANDEGDEAWPSLDRLSHKTRLPKRTVMRCIGRLEEAGGLEVERPERNGRGHHNRYRIRMEKGGQSVPFSEPDKGREKARGPSQSVPDPLTLDMDIADGKPIVAEEGVRGRNRKTKMPEDFAPEPSAIEWAKSFAPGVDLDHETAQFRDYWIAKGETRANWQAGWRSWIRNAKRFAAERGSSTRNTRRAPVPDGAERRDLPSGEVDPNEIWGPK